MPTYSQTFTFAPSLGELGLAAFSRIQLFRSEITQEHMINLRLAANLMLADWSIDVPNLWAVDLITTTCTPGQATYDVDPTTIAILDAYISTPNGDGTNTDLIILPVSRTEYASFPEKAQQGRSTVFWFDRLIDPTITLWLVPDDTQVYTLKYYRVRQIMDANFTNGQNPEIPYRFFEAFVAGLAAKLAEIYRPAMSQMLDAKAAQKFEKAREQDTENVPLSLIPGLSSYWGR